MLRLPEGELDLARSVTSGQVFRWRQVDGVWHGYDGPTWWRVVESSPGDFKVESNAPRETFESYFRLQTSFDSVASRIVAACPEVEPAVAQLWGLRLLRPTNPEEVLFCFVCTQNNHLSRITQMIRTLEGYGQNRFPNAAEIAAIPEAELRSKGFGYRGRTLPLVAQQVVERGPRWLEGLKTASYDAAFGELVQLYGIGPKLADCVALYGLHHNAAVPVDTHLWQAACRHFFPGFVSGSLTLKRYREIGDRFRELFGELAGWAQLFLYYENLLNWRNRKSNAPSP